MISFRNFPNNINPELAPLRIVFRRLMKEPYLILRIAVVPFVLIALIIAILGLIPLWFFTVIGWGFKITNKCFREIISSIIREYI